MMNRPAAEEIYHKGLTKSGAMPKEETNPSECVYAVKTCLPPYWIVDLICHFPARYGTFCNGVCGDMVTRDKSGL